MRPSRHRISFTVRNWLTSRREKSEQTWLVSIVLRREEKKLVHHFSHLQQAPLQRSSSPRAPHDFYDGICLSLEKGKPTRACSREIERRVALGRIHVENGKFFKTGEGTTFLFSACQFAFVDVPLSLYISPNPFSPPVIPLCISFFSRVFSFLSLSLSSLLENVLPTYPWTSWRKRWMVIMGRRKFFFKRKRKRERQRGSKKFVIYEKAWLWRKNNVKGQPSVVKRLLQSKGFFTPGSGFALLLTFKEGGEAILLIATR